MSPLLVFVAPVCMLNNPVCPATESPVSMDMLPDVEECVAPVDSEIEPEIPDPKLLAVTTVTLPDEVTSPFPDDIATCPPVRVLLPADRKINAPIPEPEDPAISDTEPAVPDSDDPEPRRRLPVLPEVDVPDLTLTSPLSLLPRAAPEANTRAPDRPLRAVPENTDTVPVEPTDAENPDENKSRPELPAEVEPVATVKEPEFPTETTSPELRSKEPEAPD